jgi:hypothetical protein
MGEYHEFTYGEGDIYKGKPQVSLIRSRKERIFCFDGAGQENMRCDRLRERFLIFAPGQWNVEGHRHGLGIVRLLKALTFYSSSHDDVVLYCNCWSHGRVQLKFADGSMYAGQFSDGYNHGHGVYTFGGDKVRSSS